MRIQFVSVLRSQFTCFVPYEVLHMKDGVGKVGQRKQRISISKINNKHQRFKKVKNRILFLHITYINVTTKFLLTQESQECLTNF